MKKINFAGFASLMVLSLATAGATTLYDNSTGRQPYVFSDGTTEFGNEVVLAGPGAFTVTNFSFEYYGLNFTGSEQADVRIYENNGTPFNTFATPGTLLFDSGEFGIGQTGVGGASLDFNLENTPNLNSFSLTNDITFTVQFSNVGATNAGVDIYYNPGTGGATVGTNFGDMWVNTGSGWQLQSDTNAPLGIGAQFQGTQAVPEPTAVMLGLLGGVAGLMVVFRARRV
jgi:hypothetical protein